MDGQNNLSQLIRLKQKLQSAQLPANLVQRAQEQIDRAELALKYGGNLSHMDVVEKYIDWIVSLPWYAETSDQLDMVQAKKILDKNHYGLEKVKTKLLEYLSVYKMQKEKNQDANLRIRPLFFVGLAGTGKTTFAISVAEALGRRFVRIPFGGLSSAGNLRGHAKTNPEAQPGVIMKALKDAQVRNPVILLDELDRIVPESRAEIMGVLLELLDPAQNIQFTDYFIDFPFDLSHVLFLATANNTQTISPPVLDRMELIQMPSYSDEEKIEIGKRFILPKYMQYAGVDPKQLTVDDALWSVMVRPLGFEPGIRSLERLIETMVRKVAYKLVTGQGTSFFINESNLREFK
ncbi:AAA family ATPase [Candidatus Woesebacteria bacterium]|nr:AAA family ATPase [Candidatus Woesebacteria bacterium]